MSFQVMKKKFFIQCLFLLMYNYSFSQTYTMNDGSNAGVSKCTGIFVDSGGSGTDYSFNETSTITFCPVVATDKIKISFTSFDTEDDGSGGCFDYLDVWYANTVGASGTQKEEFCGTLNPFSIISTSADGCISLKFTSDGFTNRSGWVANVSCITPCTPPTASLKSNSTADICSPSASNPGSLTLPFDASSSTTPSGSITKYEWDWGDGKKETTTTPTTTHLFPSQGIFVVKLSVRNNNTSFDPLGCQSTNSASQIIRVLPPPNFTGTTSSPLNISCGDSITLNGVITSQTIAQATPSAVSSTTSLPDGSGLSFNSGIDYTGFFPPGAKVSPGCYPTLTFNIEHSYSGDLSIDLIAPSGQTVRVYNDNFGNSNMFGTCSNYNDDGVPGCGASYSVVNSGAVNWPAEGTSGTTKTPKSCSSYSGSCNAGNYYIPKTYNSANSFSGFNGADLNGIWTIRITDNLQYDDGTLFSWSLSFPKSCYVNLESVTPSLTSTSASWSHSGTGPTIPAHTTTSSSVTNPGPAVCPSGSTCVGSKLNNTVAIGPFSSLGSFVYNLNTKDQFGCEYINPVTVNVTCSCPTASINYATNSFCSSDTNVKTVTLTGAGAFTGGTYSSTTGLTINATTGSITPSTSNPGTYSVNYTIPASNGCGTYVASTTITIITTTTAPSFTLTQPSCTEATGSITILAVAGATHSFDSGPYNSTLTYNELLAGSSHTLSAKDSGGCISPISNFILNTQPVTPAAPSVTVNQPNCDVATGSVIINGISGETYSLNSEPYSLNLVYKDLVASASHTFYAKNEAGCISSGTTIVLDAQHSTPIATATPNAKSICSGDTTAIVLSSNIPDTTFSWNSLQNNVTGAVAGSGDTIAQTLTTASNKIGEVIYAVTPTANDCSGIPILVNIIVNPIPNVNAKPNEETLCSEATTNITLTSIVAGTTFSWTVVQTGVIGAFNSTGAKIAQALKTFGTIQGTVDYTITPRSNGCAGIPNTITVKVNPTPEVFGPTLASICSGESTAIVLTPNILGTQFGWTVNQIGVTGATDGKGDSINQVLEAGTSVGTAIYTITPFLEECSGKPITSKVKVNPSPAPIVTDGIICVKQNTNTTFKSYIIETGLSNSNYNFEWYLNNEKIIGSTSNSFEAVVEGLYSVIVTNKTTSCKAKESVVAVTPNYPADSFTAVVSNAFAEDATIIVTELGGTGPFLYQIDDGPLQSSNVFSGLSSGTHSVRVKDEQGCTNLSQNVIVIDYPKYFTPNGDGINDTWNIKSLINQPDAKIFIFDRYGKLIKQIEPTGKGWDGVFNGHLLPAEDYWFTVEYLEGNVNKLFKAHFSLKR